MPRFSARLLAIEGWGSLRREVGAGEEALEEDGLLLVEAFSEEDLVAPSEIWLALAPGFLSLRGASLMRPASLRWWSSRRLRMRRACLQVRDYRCIV
jgi:hypothetical protein